LFVFISQTMSQSQWKAYFSMHVLGQTDMVYNPVTKLNRYSLHQSCPWSATVINFEEYHRRLKFPYDCYNCQRPCKEDYCKTCIDNPCGECGDISCGGYCVLDRCPGCENGRGDRCRSCKHWDY